MMLGFQPMEYSKPTMSVKFSVVTSMQNDSPGQISTSGIMIVNPLGLIQLTEISPSPLYTPMSFPGSDSLVTSIGVGSSTISMSELCPQDPTMVKQIWMISVPSGTVNPSEGLRLLNQETVQIPWGGIGLKLVPGQGSPTPWMDWNSSTCGLHWIVNCILMMSMKSSTDKSIQTTSPSLPLAKGTLIVIGLLSTAIKPPPMNRPIFCGQELRRVT